ncbi:hypothetical protein F511_46492 [Dorcoceras hygrometricum]|uniref:Uncharacterized protein n=1 Tax=Dorcoceras hygrometricum TaxID=472368 RepID=A0A2Z7A098_9LAMI|nr:hypothetical protein F511_46492 [Dorcoceras hygrometricum]
MIAQVVARMAALQDRPPISAVRTLAARLPHERPPKAAGRPCKTLRTLAVELLSRASLVVRNCWSLADQYAPMVAHDGAQVTPRLSHAKLMVAPPPSPSAAPAMLRRCRDGWSEFF